MRGTPGATRYKRRVRTRHNPYHRNPARGGTNWLLIGGVAAGAFFLMRGGGLATIFGGGVPAGYTQLGTSGYYRGPDGMLYNRTATGGMVRSATQVAPGSTWEQQLITAGVQTGVPLIGSGIQALGSWLGNLFTGGGGSTATGSIPSTAGEVVVAPGDIFAPEGGGLAPLPELPELALGDWWSAPEGSADWWTETPVAAGEPSYSLWGGETGTWEYGIPELPPLPSVEIAWVDPDFVSSEPAGFWGLRGLGRYRAPFRGGYGQVRRGPSGEVEARFLRQPPSYR